MSAQVKTKTREEALTETIEAQQTRLLSAIRKRVRNQVDAEDVFQETVGEFVRAYDLGTVIENVSAWLVTVAQNKILDRFRRRKTEDKHRTEVLDASAAAGAAEATTTSKIGEPEVEFGRAIMREEILEAIAQLPPEQRDVFIRNEVDGQSFEDIAQETGVGINTLLSRKRYAVLALRSRLKEIYDELE